MPRSKIIIVIAAIEILIGAITLCAIVFSLLTNSNAKTANVLIFVITTSCLSILLGIGLLSSKKMAYDLLIYFSSIIILSKILIFTNIIGLNGYLETSIPDPIKNSISIFYHSFVIAYLRRRNIRKLFIK